MTNYQNLPYKVIGTDTSFWEGLIDIRTAFANGISFILPKASHGTGTDSQFYNTWNNSRGILKRGAFHWLTINESIKAQAKHFASLLKNDPGEIEPYVDFEESGQFWVRRNPVTGKRGWNRLTVSELRGFIKYFHDEFPVWPWKNDIGIYTRFYYWRDYGSRDLEWLNHPLWVSDPDPVSIPDTPYPWMSFKFWQTDFSADGPLFGTNYLVARSVDMNVYNGTLDNFAEEYGEAFTPPPPPPPPETTQLFSNAVYEKDGDLHMIKITGGRWKVTKFGYKTVSQVARETGADIAINGGDHRDMRAVGRYVVQGIQYSKQVEYEPYVDFQKDNKVRIHQWGEKAAYNAIAGKRNLILNGAKGRTSQAWNDKARRTLIGTNGSTTIIVVSDGQITLHEAADIMLKYGCQFAIDLDGGRSSQIEIPSIELSIGSEPVGNHIVWYKE